MTNLKLIRLVKNMSQSEISKSIRISRQRYSMIEHGRLIPTKYVAEKIEQSFQKSMEFLLDTPNYENLLKEA